MLYGILLSAGFVISVFLMWRLYKSSLAFIRFSVTLDVFFDSVLVFFLAFGLGARALFIIERGNTLPNIFSWFLFLHFPGFSFWGGVIGGIIGLWIFCKLKKLPFLLLLDVFVISLPFLLSVSQIGKLLTKNIVYPIELLEMIGALVIFALLHILYTRGKSQAGMIALYFLLLIGILGFFVAIFWGNSVYLNRFSVTQAVSAAFSAVAIVLLAIRKRKDILFLLKGRFTSD